MTKRSPDFLVRSHDPLNGGPGPARQVESFITPNDSFFVRNHGAVPAVAAEDYRLEVGGMVGRTAAFTLADLHQGFERVEVTSTLACAGQRRIEMATVAPIPGELPWGQEAVSTAVWGGWRLADVLAAVAVQDGAAHVAFEGLDQVERRSRTFRYGASIPLAKALAPEVLLADTMNGAQLPPEHGYPLRVVVPGYIGARQVKWLARIQVQAAPSDNYFQAVAYRSYPRTMTHVTHDPAQGVELTELQVNCLLARPIPGERVGPGPVSVRGAAYTGCAEGIAAVEVSGDGGSTWVSATLAEPPSLATDWTWRLFECEVEVVTGADGRGEVIARAHDARGATQPRDARGIWNFKGYMNNAWARVAVERDPASR